MNFQLRCPVCAGSAFARTDDDNFVRCTRVVTDTDDGCGLIMQVALPDGLGDAYSRPSYDAMRRDVGGRSCWARVRHDEAVAAARLGQLGLADPAVFGPQADGGGPLWCDYGCGNGAVLTTARRAGYDVVGVELDAAFATEVSRLTGCQVWPAYDEALGFACDQPPVRALSRKKPSQPESGRLNVLSFFDVIEHAVDPVGLVGMWAARLAPYGRLVIEVPDCGSRGGYIKGWTHHKPGEHLFHFTEKSLTGLVYKAAPELSVIHTARPVPDKLQMVWSRCAKTSAGGGPVALADPIAPLDPYVGLFHKAVEDQQTALLAEGLTIPFQVTPPPMTLVSGDTP